MFINNSGHRYTSEITYNHTTHKICYRSGSKIITKQIQEGLVIELSTTWKSASKNDGLSKYGKKLYITETKNSLKK